MHDVESIARSIIRSIVGYIDKQVLEPLRASLRRFAPDLTPLAEAWGRLFAPGTFLGDVRIVRSGPGPQQEAAMHRLAGSYFSKGTVFYPNRWQCLEPAFNQRKKEQSTSWSRTWDGLVLPELVLACGNPNITKQYIGDLYRWMRREVGKGVERNLLHGETLDEYKGRGTVPWEDTPEALALEARMADDWVEIVDGKIDLARMLSSLAMREAEMVRRRLRGDSWAEIAEDTGEKAGTLRVRMHRLCKKLRESGLDV